MENSINHNYLKCVDFRVSGKEFILVPVEEGTILKTTPVPSEVELPSYYETEDYISHTDSKKSFLDRIYQWVKTMMLKRKLNWISEHQKRGSILDVGAGTGDFLLQARAEGWKAFGVEPSQRARERALSKGLPLKEEIDTDLQEKYDVITMWHVLEHVPDYHAEIEKLKKLLKPGGLLVIAVPNFLSYDALQYKAFWAGYDVPRHLWHFSRTGIKNAVSGQGFLFEKERPLVFDSFYVSLLSEHNKSGNTRIFSAVSNGLFSNLRALRTGEYSSLAYFFRKP